MRIVIIPNAPVMAGRHFCIAQALSRQGHDIHYLTWELPYKISPKAFVKHLFTSLRSRTYRYEGMTVHTARRLPYFWPVVNGLIFRKQLNNLFRNLHADFVFTEGYTNETAVRASTPFIYDLADDYAAPAEVYGSPFYKFAFKILGVRSTMAQQSKQALAVTAVSEILYKYGITYNPHTIKLPNGVESSIIRHQLKQDGRLLANPHSLVYVTRFGQWSRAVETLGIVTELRQQFPDIHLTLVGEGTETGRIKDYIATHAAEPYIDYRGFVYDRQKLFEIMNKSAVGLNISDKNKWRDAAHPIKVIEYSALGKIVVSTSLYEVQALKLENILLFDDASEQTSFKAALTHALIRSSKHPDYTKISDDILTTYDWEKIATHLVTLAKKRLAETSR